MMSTSKTEPTAIYVCRINVTRVVQYRLCVFELSCVCHSNCVSWVRPTRFLPENVVHIIKKTEENYIEGGLTRNSNSL
jgi:hypothetical protein